MVNTTKPPSVVAAPTSRVAVVEIAGGGVILPLGEALPRFRTLTVEGVGWPQRPGAWVRLELEYDSRRTPPLRCRLDGEETTLEQDARGIWRPVAPRRTENDG